MDQSHSTSMVDDSVLSALAFRHTPTPTLVLHVGATGDGRDAGPILAVSDSFLQLLGEGAEAVVGHGLQEFVDPDDEDRKSVV